MFAISCSQTEDALQPDEVKALASRYDAKAGHFENIGKYDSAFINYTRAKEWYEAAGDSVNVAYRLLYRLAPFYKKYNNYDEYEATAAEALSFMGNRRTVNDSAYLAEIYNIYGIAFTDSKNFTGAVANYTKAAAYTGSDFNKLFVRNNLAYVYIAAGDYSKAIAILEKVAASKSLNDSMSIRAIVFDNLGYAYLKSGNNKAVPYLNKALLLREKYQDSTGLIASYIHLSEYSVKTNRMLAYIYAQKAYAIATAIQSTDDRIEALLFLMHTVTGKEYETFSARRIALQDSISNIRKQANNQFAAVKYEARKEKEDNKKLRIEKAFEKEKRRTRTVLTVFIVLAGAAATVFFFRRQRSKHRKITEKRVYDAETRISQQVHDELANDLYQLMNFADLRDLSGDDKEILLNTMEQLYFRTRAISHENNTIDTSPDFPRQLKEMIVGFNGNGVLLLHEGFDNMPWELLEDYVKRTVYRTIQELLINMRKHSNCNQAVLVFRKENGFMHIEYSDNGNTKEEGEILLNNGLQNVENRIQAIKGTFTFGFVSGKFKAHASFPV